MSGRRTGLPLGLLLGFALVVGQVALMVGVFVAAPHSGGDNAGYVALADALLGGAGYVEAWDPARPPHTKYPPVFPALLAVAIALGARTWAALKIVPAVFATGAVLLTYLWAFERRGPLFGFTVAGLLALAPALLSHSHWVLSDVPFLALIMLALWALERGDAWRARADGAGARRTGADGADVVAGGAGGRGAAAWLALGAAAAVAAYFTRTAGLPLLLAVGAWFALRRRWGWVAGFALAAGVPALLWAMRGRGDADAAYIGEFWLVDPYQPELGRVGLGGLVARMGDNLQLYVGQHLPAGLFGESGGWGTLLGFALVAVACWGWARRVGVAWPGGAARPAASEQAVAERPASGPAALQVAELFLPLYAGLILLWPAVWGGDRFALPLLPLVLFYAGEALVAGVRRVASVRWEMAAAVAAAALLALPALGSWGRSFSAARDCGALTRAAGPYACYGASWQAFVEAARWSSANLAPGSPVLTRKPRIFYVLSGLPSVTYPFVAEPEAFLGDARDTGAGHVLLDRLGPQAERYVGAVVRARPEAFCAVRAFSGGLPAGGGGGGAGATQLLGIDPGEGRGGQLVRGEDGRLSVGLPACPARLSPADPVEPPPLLTLDIPLLLRGQSAASTPAPRPGGPPGPP